MKSWRMFNVASRFCGVLAYSMLVLSACAGNPESKPVTDADFAAVKHRANASYDDVDDDGSSLEYESSASIKNSQPAPASSMQNSTSAGSSTPVVSAKASLAEIACPDPNEYLRGEGIGKNAAIALQQAQKQIAAQIQSTMEASEKLNISQSQAGGNESLKQSYSMSANTYTHLENAQDAREAGRVEVNGKVGVVACMSKEDAMKPFWIKAEAMQDSLKLLAATYEGTTHPVEKHQLYKTAQTLYPKYLNVKNTLESFDEAVDESAQMAFAEMTENYRAFKADYAFYYSDGIGGDLEKSMFSILSRNYHLIAATCKGNGIQLSLEVQDGSCSSGSLGVMCSADVALYGSSCEGDTYFSLNTSVSGNGRYGEGEARDNVKKKVAKGDWLKEWKMDLDKWVLK